MTEKWEYPMDVVCSNDEKRACAIRLGYVYCDGYSTEAKIGAFSHFHDDHSSSIPKCLNKYDLLITHHKTLRAFENKGWSHYEQWHPMEYGESIRTNSLTIRLLKANHIPGSAQIFVQTDDKSMLYSGDFNYPFATITETDYLVLDATHGDPSVDGKTDRKSVLNRMYEHVKEIVDDKKSVVIYTNQGTLQEIIRHFEIVYEGNEGNLSHDIHFVAKKDQIEILNSIYKEERNEFRVILEYGTREFWKLIRSHKPCVVFLVDKNMIEDLQHMYRIFTDRYQYRSSKGAIIHHSSTNSSHYNLASHASIDNVISYVKDTKAKVVVTDGSRSKQAKALARQIELSCDDRIRVFTRGNTSNND